jgi:hypothetical protein
MFRDETSRTAIKVQSSKTKPSEMLFSENSTLSSDLASELAVWDFVSTKSSGLPSKGPTFSHEAQAISYYFHYYVGNRTGFAVAVNTALPNSSNAKFNTSPLGTAITSLGMAGLANISNSPETRLAARKKYMYAIQLTQKALQDPVRVKAADTFWATTVLSLVEVSPHGPLHKDMYNTKQYQIITSQDAKKFRTWAHHVTGAASILILSGTSQKYPKNSLSGFFQARAQLVSCQSMLQGDFNHNHANCCKDGDPLSSVIFHPRAAYGLYPSHSENTAQRR